MAENDINSQEILNRLLNETNQAESEHLGILRNIGSELKLLLGTQRARTEEEKSLLSLSTRMQDSAKKNLEHLAKTQTLGKQILKDEKLINEATTERGTLFDNLNKSQRKYLKEFEDASNKVALSEENLFNKRKEYEKATDSRERGNIARQIKTAEKQLAINKEKYLQALNFQKVSKKQIQLEEELANKIAEKEKASTDRYTTRGRRRTQAIQDEARLIGEISQLRDKIRAEKVRSELPNTARQDILKIVHLDQMAAEMKKIKEEREEAEKIEKSIEKRMGLSGTALKGLSGTMKMLGVDTGVVAEALKEAQDEMRKLATEAEVEGLSGEMSRVNILAAGAKVLLNKVVEQAFSLESVLAFVGRGLIKANENTTKFRKELGVGYLTSYQMNLQMEMIGAKTMDNFISSEKLRKSFFELSQILEMNVATLGGGMLVSMTNLTERLGMSTQEAGNLTSALRLNGENIESQLDTSGEVLTNFNKQNKTTFSIKYALKEIANTSKGILMNYKGSTQELIKAYGEAHKVGLSLQNIEKISSNLLQWDSSISAEMEARLLTSNQINLAKAREYALTNDIAGVAREVGNQEAVINAFRTKNVIAQQSVAAALGMSRDELADMVMKQQLVTLSTKEFKEAWGETAYEQTKSLSTTDQFKALLEKVKTLAVGILSAFEPIIWVLGKILSIPLLPHILTIGAGIFLVAKNVGSIGRGLTSLLTLFKGLNAQALLFRRNTQAATTSLNPPTPPAGGSAGPAQIFQGLAKVPWKTLASGALVVAAFAGSIWVFSKAMENLKDIPLDKIIGTLGGFTIAIAAITAVMAGLATSGVAWVALGVLGGFALAFLGFGAAMKIAASALTDTAESFQSIIGSIASIDLAAISNVIAMAKALDTLAESVEGVNRKGPISLFDKDSQAAVKQVGLTKRTPQEESNLKLMAKIDELIAVVKAGGDVYMDSNKVGIALAMGTYRQR